VGDVFRIWSTGKRKLSHNIHNYTSSCQEDLSLFGTEHSERFMFNQIPYRLAIAFFWIIGDSHAYFIYVDGESNRNDNQCNGK
jgi:hypothetical protein